MIKNKNMGKFKSIIDWDEHKLISEDMEKYTQMSMGDKDIKWLYMFYIPKKYRLSMEATKGMSIDELHSACEMCLNKYFSAVQNGIENPPTLNTIVGYPIEEDLLFYFAMDFLNKENKFIRVSDIKCSCTCTNNHKIEYEVTWPDGGKSLLNSEFQFILQPGESEPYKYSQCIHVYDFHNINTKKGIALYGRKINKYYLSDLLSIIKTNGDFLQIPMDDFIAKVPITSFPISYGILYKESILFIENRDGVHAFDIYRGYICCLKGRTLSNLNQEDMARICFEDRPIDHWGTTSWEHIPL